MIIPDWFGGWIIGIVSAIIVLYVIGYLWFINKMGGK